MLMAWRCPSEVCVAERRSPTEGSGRESTGSDANRCAVSDATASVWWLLIALVRDVVLSGLSRFQHHRISGQCPCGQGAGQPDDDECVGQVGCASSTPISSRVPRGSCGLRPPGVVHRVKLPGREGLLQRCRTRLGRHHLQNREEFYRVETPDLVASADVPGEIASSRGGSRRPGTPLDAPFTFG